MHILITQPSVDIAGDLIFTQPKFHFGQVLEDLKGDKGFVVGMNFDGDNWSYILFYTELLALGKEVPESQLASSSTTIVAIDSYNALQGS